MYCLYRVVQDSLLCPNVVPVSALRALCFLSAFLAIVVICVEKVK